MATKRLIRRSTAASAPSKPNGGVSKKVASRPPVDDEDEPTTLAGRPRPSTNGVDEEGEIRGGWSASQETIDSTSQYAQTFRPTTDSQVIKVLDAKPYASFRRHWIDRVGIGKRAYTCYQSVGKDCPLCNVGDKPGAVTAFNIAVVADDGGAAVKSWECAVKLTQQMRTYNNDPKIGPLDKRSLYFLVSKTEAKQRQQASTMVNPVRERDLLEDYGVPPLTDEQIEKLLANCYTADIVSVETPALMNEVAAEITGEDVEEKGWG